MVNFLFSSWFMAICTGMRNGELYALKWKNVDLDNRQIKVSRTWTSISGFKNGKIGRDRIVEITPLLL